ncbi:gluconate 2-dehydrogenase subunit 3 family protein [Algibacter sp. 2305UL17-15]|uniref:gluconate 2-dehydrogenase subunit 3 family protein n=1 Tax=Algibacter sp. 2305UL17-15 TaxID=3231268 RepID=UPI00345901CB
MNRRDALKNISLGVGYTLAAPSILSLLQSCKSDVEAWVPIFLSLEEGVVLKNLVDLILPKTEDTPGALEVNVPEFIDLFMAKGENEEHQAELRAGFASIMTALNIPEEDPSKLKTEDYDALLAKYLKADKTQLEKFKTSETDKLIFETLNYIRGKSIWAYKTSEFVGEKVLAYDPIPGPAKGCITVEEATGGKAWSL